MATRVLRRAAANQADLVNRAGYVDRGYRGHDADHARVFISRQKRSLTPTIRRELRRRNGAEPTIGHMKADSQLDRNFLLGAEGDAINAILAAVGQNLRLLRRWLARLLALPLIAFAMPSNVRNLRPNSAMI